MSSNLVLPDGLGDEGDCEGHDRCEDEGDGGEVEEVDVAHGGLDPLGTGVGLRRAAGGLAETELYKAIKVNNIFGKLFFPHHYPNSRMKRTRPTKKPKSRP